MTKASFSEESTFFFWGAREWHVWGVHQIQVWLDPGVPMTFLGLLYLLTMAEVAYISLSEHHAFFRAPVGHRC